MAGSGATSEAGSQRERVLGPFLASHWRLPVPPQGPAPASFSETHEALDPAMCGTCHPKQFGEWRTSLHARAWSPGLAGQLLEGELANPVEVRACQTCHTPLSEQMPFDATLAANSDFDPALRARGVLCAGCHVRAHRYFGPPARPEAPSVPEPRPHAGFEPRSEYQQSRFCAECHQFFDDAGVAGKPIENTWAEWAASPAAAEERSCQDCHMPDRAHLWRGIHDPEMVRAAIDVELLELDPDSPSAPVALVLHNRGAGHAFPSYVTPRVFLELHQVDASGAEIAGTRIEAQIGRSVDFARGVEVSDTRVLQGESVRLDYTLPPADGAVALVGRVSVDPDHHYRNVFELLLESLEGERARSLIRQAADEVADSVYLLAERRLPLPPGARATGAAER
jgi:hypothetical protein